jgi:hypothetical protein
LRLICYLRKDKERFMPNHRVFLQVAFMTGLLIPALAHSADTDYQAAADRMRQTGEQIRESIKNARARHEAMVVRQAAEQKREAELEKQRQQQDLKDRQLKQAQEEERARHQAAAAKARLQAAEAAQAKQTVNVSQVTDHTTDLLEAKRRAAEALREMQESGGIKGYE